VYDGRDDDEDDDGDAPPNDVMRLLCARTAAAIYVHFSFEFNKYPSPRIFKYSKNQFLPFGILILNDALNLN